MASCLPEDWTREVIFADSGGSGGGGGGEKPLRIIHFNDVYNIESGEIEPKAGAARFHTAVHALKNARPDVATLVLFSGDAFSPSTISLVTKGKQMIPVLNGLDVSVACVGNHDFDFGVECLENLIGECNFPWLMSNVLDEETRQPMAASLLQHVVTIKNIRIGFIGLVEKEWIETLSTLEYDDVCYESFIECGVRMAKKLREEERVDYVIALTHMRQPNDILLAQNAPGIDIILGGHDHHYIVEQVNQKWVVKSGSDFKDLSVIEMSLNENKSAQVMQIDHYIIDSKVPENEQVVSLVGSFMSKLKDYQNYCREIKFFNVEEEIEAEMKKVIGYINTELDGRFTTVRLKESNLGNFFCDIVMQSVNCDVVIINSGTFRSDCIHPAGEFKIGDLKKIIPFPDPVLVLRVTGRILHQVLENGVSQYPKLEGRFPQVGGVAFAFDPSKPGGSRIEASSIKVQGEPLDYDREYNLATKMYLREGKDGYNMLVNCPVLLDEEEGPLLFTIISGFFEKVDKIKTQCSCSKVLAKRPSLAPRARRLTIIKEFALRELHKQQSFDDGLLSDEPHVVDPTPTRRRSSLNQTGELDLPKDAIRCAKNNEECIQLISTYEKECLKMSPQLDGRITCIQAS